MVRQSLRLGIVLAVAAVTTGAHADPKEGAVLGDELPPLMPRLQLTWPIAPQRLSFDLSRPILSADGPLQPYHYQATWWRSGPLELLSFQSVDQSFELECRLTCQPVIERSWGAEARYHLGGSGAVPDPYLFARRAVVLSPLKTEGRLLVGLGGQLDL